VAEIASSRYALLAMTTVPSLHDTSAVNASEAKQSILLLKERLDCFATLAMTEDRGCSNEAALRIHDDEQT
jgi:hypothetical protein